MPRRGHGHQIVSSGCLQSRGQSFRTVSPAIFRGIFTSQVGQTDLVFGMLFHHGSLLGLCM